MSGRQRILFEIEAYDTGKLSEFLEANGQEEFTRVLQIKNVDGAHFLAVNEYEILSWKPHITLQQVRKLWAFIKHFKENPEKYTIPKKTFPRPNITRQQLESLCNDEQAINKLHNLLRERELQETTCDNQEDSFSSEEETYVNHDAVIQRIPNRSTLHRLSFKDPTEHLKPMTKLSQKFDTSSDTDDADEFYENAFKNSVRDMENLTLTKDEDETEELYENRPISRAKEDTRVLPTPSSLPKSAENPKCNLGIQALPRPPFPKSSKPYNAPFLSSTLPKLKKTEESENSKCNLGSQVLSRTPLPKSSKPYNEPVSSSATLPKSKKTDEPEKSKCNLGFQVFPRLPVPKSLQIEPALGKENAFTPFTKLKPLPPVPQDEQKQPPVPSRGGTKSEQTATVTSPNKNTSQFLNARSHLANVLSGKVSPKNEEALDEYIEPNPVQEEEVYEPEPKFRENQSRNQLPKTSAIQALPLPPLPTRDDKFETASRTFNKREIQSRALPKPPQLNFERPTQVGTLPRPSLPTEETISDLECYRNINRKRSEMLLTEKLGDGAYLFRPSEQYFCTLSVRCESKIYHIGIKQNNDGQLECLSSGRHLLFDDVKQICEHFKKYPLRMIDNYNNYKSILLRDVLPRDRT